MFHKRAEPVVREQQSVPERRHIAQKRWQSQGCGQNFWLKTLEALYGIGKLHSKVKCVMKGYWPLRIGLFWRSF